MTYLAYQTIIPAYAKAAFKSAITNHPAYGDTKARLFSDTPQRSLTKTEWIDIANSIAEQEGAFNFCDELRALLTRLAANAPAIETNDETNDEDMRDDETNDDETPRPELTADGALDVVAPFLSGKLLDDLKTALAPLVAAANKAPEKIVETVYVETATPVAPGTSPRIQTPSQPILGPVAKKVDTSTLKKTFGFSGKHASSPCSIWDASNAPSPDPFYVVEPKLLALAMTALERGRNVWLAGPAGSGKSTLPREIAAKTRRPFVRIAFERGVESFDFVGVKELDGAGGMIWVDGVLTQSMRRAGTIILLDELCFAPPGVQAMLQTVLDSKTITLRTGEVVKAAPGVVFVVADNTAGYGDTTGVYAGTVQANGALVDRMSRLVNVDYLDPELEASALVNHTGAPHAAARRLVDFVAQVRRTQAQEGTTTRPLSLRRLVAFVETVQDGFTCDEAFEVTMLSRLPDADRETLRQAVKAHFDQRAFNDEMDGKTAAPAFPSTPEQEAAKASFDAVETL